MGRKKASEKEAEAVVEAIREMAAKPPQVKKPMVKAGRVEIMMVKRAKTSVGVLEPSCVFAALPREAAQLKAAGVAMDPEKGAKWLAMRAEAIALRRKAAQDKADAAAEALAKHREETRQ